MGNLEWKQPNQQLSQANNSSMGITFMVEILRELANNHKSQGI